ncbi:MAG: precorrin-4 C(11)-methyltransferase [Candidatus Hydrothermarchaeales archaeon]
MTVYIIGAGPGDPELITLKAKAILERADVVVYAGSLINPEILKYAKTGAELYDSAGLTLEEIFKIIKKAANEGKVVARLHSGDPSLYGATQEQMALLRKEGINYKVIPGVSSIFAAAASLKREYTVPDVSQSLIITRLAGRTSVPEKEKLGELARHRCSMGVFLSAHMIEEAVEELKRGYGGAAPVAVVYRVSWKDEKIITGKLSDIASKVKAAGVNKTAIILVGDFLSAKDKRSRLYSGEFEHSFRTKKEEL